MDIYAIVTEKIISLLEQGTIPWRKPWTSAGLPRNLITKKPYRGVNVFLLSASKYISPFWLTLRQANELGGHVRKGEESTIVVYWRVDNVDYLRRIRHARDDLLHGFNRIVLVRFDLRQFVEDGLRQSALFDIEQAVVRAGTKAFYSPLTDRVTLPPRELFISAEEEACTTAHELSHSSGHPKRLAREGIAELAPFGSPIYSGEELVAELSAAYICAEAGISNAVVENQAAYIAGWLKKLRDERRLLISAAAQAQRAADYILNRTHAA